MKRRNFLLLAVAPIFIDASGIALKGYDPVAYFILGKPAKGRSEFAHTHAGATYHFLSPENRQRFIEKPDAFLPQYGGYCAWAVSNNYTAPVDPLAWKIVDGKLYLNYSQEVQSKWMKDMQKRIDAANQNWPHLHK